jgi:hypothetical protein
MTEERTKSLIARWLDGSITREEFADLERVLRGCPEARAHLRREVNLDAVLREQAAMNAGLEAWTNSAPAKGGMAPSLMRRFWLAATLAGCAALVLTLGAFFLGGHRATQKQVAQQEPEELNLGCAILTNAWNTEWLDDSRPMRSGDTLNAGRFELGCGLAQIEFFSGAQMLFEGPGTIEIISPWEAVCHDGKARVRVPPPAQGFRLLTPGMKLVDLGTEFGVQVNGAAGTGEVHVFEGEVEAHPSHGKMVSLKEGMGLKREGETFSPLATTRPDDFASLDRLRDLAHRNAQARFNEWSAWSLQMRRDPRLLACYVFRHWLEWDRLVNNVAADNLKSRNGGAVGARWTQGRWPMKDALEFKRPGDRVRLKLDGEYDGLTFACWVKVDGLDRRYNALLLTDGYEPGEPHWQILEDGRLMFSIAYPDPAKPDGKKLNQIYHSPVVFTRSNLGRWHQLVVTYDNCTGEAAQFLDGREVSRSTSEDYQPGRKIVYGACEMGNWGLPTQGHEFPIRNLNGCLDEFAIYDAALTAPEIRAMYEAGKAE